LPWRRRTEPRAPSHENHPLSDGQLLHAYKLEFKHPIHDQDLIFEAPKPKAFQDMLDVLTHGEVL
jgi:hypothetical protein